ncbi:UNVERIFIED_CONTAM: hypothetical protein FKN15_022408 [Acipenser sinensis]
MLPVAALCPCLRQHPNKPASITGLHIFLYGPSDLPVQFETTGKPGAFLRDLACLVDWEQYNLQGIQCADPQLLEGDLNSSGSK